MGLYGRAVAEVLIDGALPKDEITGPTVCRELMDIRDDGIWPKSAEDWPFRWKPCFELDGVDGPDPLTEPGLPIPFTANHLAAFMLDGVGWFLLEQYGDWPTGPDESVLASLGPEARTAQEVLQKAYELYRHAAALVEPLDPTHETDAEELEDKYQKENAKANEREGVFDLRLSYDERGRRRERAKAGNRDLKAATTLARSAADEHIALWRRTMVICLLTDPALSIAPAPEALSTRGAEGERAALPRQRPERTDNLLRAIMDAWNNGLSRTATASETFDYLASHDDTGFIRKRDGNELTWENSSGGISHTSLKSLANRLTRYRREDV